MDQRRFERALALRDSGRIEDALQELRSMVEESTDNNEKSSLMINEVRCYSSLGRLSDAEDILVEIKKLAPDDIVVRANVDFGAACVAAQGGQHERALLRYEGMLQEYFDLLKTPEYRDLYEDIQQRRAFTLANLARYGEALPLLREAESFSTVSSEGKQEIHVYLGICYAELHEHPLAKEELLRAIDLGLENGIEAEARYRAAILYFADGAFAQAKHQLESILQIHREEILNVPRKYIYQQLSRTCHYLGERENAKRYKKLAEDS